LTGLPAEAGPALRENSSPPSSELGAGGFPGLFRGEAMTSLFTARRQHLAAALRLHARAEAVRLGTPAPSRLKCALWQTIPLCFPLLVIRNPQMIPIIRARAVVPILPPLTVQFYHPLQRLYSNLLVYSTPVFGVNPVAQNSFCALCPRCRSGLPRPPAPSHDAFPFTRLFSHACIPHTPPNTGPRPCAINNMASTNVSSTARPPESGSSSLSTSTFPVR
jgi:hypothetical protein